MKATELLRNRITYSDTEFVEVVVWRLSRPAPGSEHLYKYRLAYVVNGECILRYDTEAEKGDHRHRRGREYGYSFQSLESLLSDFRSEIRSLNDENRNT